MEADGCQSNMVVNCEYDNLKELRIFSQGAALVAPGRAITGLGNEQARSGKQQSHAEKGALNPWLWRRIHRSEYQP